MVAVSFPLSTSGITPLPVGVIHCDIQTGASDFPTGYLRVLHLRTVLVPNGVLTELIRGSWNFASSGDFAMCAVGGKRLRFSAFKSSSVFKVLRRAFANRPNLRS